MHVTPFFKFIHIWFHMSVFNMYNLFVMRSLLIHDKLTNKFQDRDQIQQYFPLKIMTEASSKNSGACNTNNLLGDLIDTRQINL